MSGTSSEPKFFLNPEVVSLNTTIEINIDFLLRLMFEFGIILIQFRIFELHRIQKLDPNLTYLNGHCLTVFWCRKLRKNDDFRWLGK